MATTFASRQEDYRKSLETFFADEEHHTRLLRLLDSTTHLFFFVREFEPHAIVHTTHGLFRMCDEYRNAMTNHKKRYYNFESKVGEGELVWKGQRNPLVGPRLPAPLPRLVALQWLIQHDFDLLYFERKDEVLEAHARHNRRKGFSARHGASRPPFEGAPSTPPVRKTLVSRSLSHTSKAGI
eukprot:CAMPEP_0184538818 /NCGR_PEP_ID=MMETSP0198_2-20121128/17795_1 /TAXON_ID=1112570 /ORGANISM="Thraustochytrium sp., Strain LLF1b" /LENGTH=181 /DNA_ID=CAMNT_0026932291 /DNA_START=691 /DNA_END=1236 /DNA_ORIENTATION=-